MQQFASVWGIGPKHALKLYQAGHRSLQDISEDQTLSPMARVGLKYHYDIALRIPQSEVSEAGSFVRHVLEDLCPGVREHYFPFFQVVILTVVAKLK